MSPPIHAESCRTRPSFIYTHEDRNEIKRRAEADFMNLYLEHGGRCRGKALHCLFHKDRRPSASIQKGRFHCFACNLSLDVIAFVERAQGIDFKSALAYLADRYAVPLNGRALTSAQRRDYAHRRVVAQNEGAKLVAWRDEMLAALREARDRRLRAYHSSMRLILTHGLDHSMGDLWADICERYEAEYQDFDRRITSVEEATFSEVLPYFRSHNTA